MLFITQETNEELKKQLAKLLKDYMLEHPDKLDKKEVVHFLRLFSNILDFNTSSFAKL